MRQQQRDTEAQRGDDQFEASVRSQQRAAPRGVSHVCPDAGHIAADAEPKHEHGDDERRGMDGVAEDVAELTDPDDLVNQSAQARAEEEEVDQIG